MSRPPRLVPPASIRNAVRLMWALIYLTHQRVFLPSPLGRRVGDEGLRHRVLTLSVQARDDFANRNHLSLKSTTIVDGVQALTQPSPKGRGQ